MQVVYLCFLWGSLNVLEIQHVLKGSWLTNVLQLAVVINQTYSESPERQKRNHESQQDS